MLHDTLPVRYIILHASHMAVVYIFALEKLNFETKNSKVEKKETSKPYNEMERLAIF